MQKKLINDSKSYSPVRNRIRFVPSNLSEKEKNLTNKDLVWIQCSEYRCMAYVDSNGHWINFYTGKKLDNFVKVIAR
jgi:hypothetical protein